jgi:hypothetical protein
MRNRNLKLSQDLLYFLPTSFNIDVFLRSDFIFMQKVDFEGHFEINSAISFRINFVLLTQNRRVIEFNLLRICVLKFLQEVCLNICTSLLGKIESREIL